MSAALPSEPQALPLTRASVFVSKSSTSARFRALSTPSSPSLRTILRPQTPPMELRYATYARTAASELEPRPGDGPEMLLIVPSASSLSVTPGALDGAAQGFAPPPVGLCATAPPV